MNSRSNYHITALVITFLELSNFLQVEKSLSTTGEKSESTTLNAVKNCVFAQIPLLEFCSLANSVWKRTA